MTLDQDMLPPKDLARAPQASSWERLRCTQQATPMRPFPLSPRHPAAGHQAQGRRQAHCRHDVFVQCRAQGGAEGQQQQPPPHITSHSQLRATAAPRPRLRRNDLPPNRGPGACCMRYSTPASHTLQPHARLPKLTPTLSFCPSPTAATQLGSSCSTELRHLLANPPVHLPLPT